MPALCHTWKRVDDRGVVSPRSDWSAGHLRIRSGTSSVLALGSVSRAPQIAPELTSKGCSRPSWRRDKGRTARSAPRTKYAASRTARKDFATRSAACCTASAPATAPSVATRERSGKVSSRTPRPPQPGLLPLHSHGLTARPSASPASTDDDGASPARCCREDLPGGGALRPGRLCRPSAWRRAARGASARSRTAQSTPPEPEPHSSLTDEDRERQGAVGDRGPCAASSARSDASSTPATSARRSRH